MSAVRLVASGERGRSPCRTRGALPPSKWKAMSLTQAQAGVRPAMGVITEFRHKTSPRPRVLRLPEPVVVGEAGRRAAFVCARAAVVPHANTVCRLSSMRDALLAAFCPLAVSKL